MIHITSHTHSHCPHLSVKYCSHCDVVYCESCGREWGYRKTYYTTTPLWVHTSSSNAAGSTFTTSNNYIKGDTGGDVHNH